MTPIQKISKSIFLAFLVSLFLFPAFDADAQYVRSRHESKANKFAKSAAKKLQDSICPLSGRALSTNVSKWIFDEYTNEYEIHFSANWNGKTWAFGDRQSFSVSGILTVSSSGYNSKFEQSYANGAVETAKLNNNLFAGAVVLGVLAAESQNN